MTHELLGQQITATNAAGARYRGRVKALLGNGRVVVACDEIDIGYGGWERCGEIKVFEPEQVAQWPPSPSAARELER